MKRWSIGVLAFALVMTGCANRTSGSASSGDPLAMLLAAATKTSDAGSARVALTLKISSGEQAYTLAGEAEYQAKSGDPQAAKAHVTLQLPSFGLGVPASEMELVLDRGVVYMKSALFAQSLGAATDWVKFDPSKMAGATPGLGSASAGLVPDGAAGVVDPAAMIAALKGAVDVREVGPDTIDGVAATKLHLSIDLVKLIAGFAANYKGPEAKRLASSIKELPQTLAKIGLSTLPADIWVDGGGFLKQLETNVSIDGSALGGQSLSFSLTETLSDIGGQFAIEAPPANQVTDISNLLPTTSTSVGSDTSSH